ncbi:MAG: MBL fold metallo-hydrolase, partial [Halioglobus sp.]
GAQEVEIHGAIGSLLGDHVARVDGVGFTHLHIDHTDGILSLCEAVEKSPLLLQTNLQRQEQNFYTQEGADILADSCLTPAEIEGNSILTSDEFPGLGMVALGGHTPGSTLFAAWHKGQLYVFSGDITNSKSDLIEDRGKGWVYSYLIVPEDTARTAQLRQWLRALEDRPDTTIVVSHDLSDFERSGLQSLR